MDTRSFICLVTLSLGFSASHPAACAANEWIKPNSGYWEEQASWSLGVLPNATQDILYNNPGWKALVIGTNTVQRFPQSMQVQSLSLGAPVDSYNTLLMNFAGLAQPLFTGYLTVGSNAAFVMQSSALDSGGLTVGGTFSQGDFSQVKVHDRLVAGGIGGGVYSGAYFLTNGTLTVEGNGFEVAEYINGGFQGQGKFVQYGGLHNTRSIEVSINGEFDLHGGQVNATNGLTVGMSDYADYATFHQHGGNVNADTVINGNYFLDGGQINGHMSVVSDTFQRVDAHVSQSGGTNAAISLDLGHPNRFGGWAYYVLSNGLVSVDSSTTFRGGQFSQYGGRHSIVSNLVLQGTDLGGFGYARADYFLWGGTLSAGGVTIQASTLQQNGGTNSIAGDIVITGPYPQGTPQTPLYALGGGLLSASNVLVSTFFGGFQQTGGIHQIIGRLTLKGVTNSPSGSYTFEGGTLVVKDILVSSNAVFQHTSGNIVHSGLLTLSAGDWRTATGDHALGPLQLTVGSSNISTITFPSGSSILRLANSSAQPWAPSAGLYINNWHGSFSGGGDSQLYFGSGTNGLTAPQLAQIKFNLSGTPQPARILPTGEVVPQTPAGGATNEWTKTTSGYWEENFWSLGHLPTLSDDWVAFRNPGFKALAIGTNTTANYSNSLLINNLIVDAPTNSANQLLLNYAGLNVPLVVRSNLIIGTNGSLISHGSALQAANVELHGFAAFSDQATEGFNTVTLRSRGALNLNDTYLTSSNLYFVGGSVTQSMGVAAFSTIATLEFYFGQRPFQYGNAYVLSGGLLVSGVVGVGHYGLSGADDFVFLQSGGVHTNSTMSVEGGQRNFQQVIHAGHYSLSNGLLVSGQTTVSGGTMDQSGGTNHTQELIVSGGGTYTLSNGQLVTSNATVDTIDCLRRGFAQNGGGHIVQSRLVLGSPLGLGHPASYSLSAGTLSAPIIEIHTDAGLALPGGTVTNSGMVVLRRGSIWVESASQQFGKLQVLEGSGYGCFAEPDIPAVIDMGSSNAAAGLRFQDSRDLPWAANLQIRRWAGSDHIFVGTNAQGLTTSQLSQITFVNPGGLPAGHYPAQILSTGEIVPAAPPPLAFTRSPGALVLSWTGDYQLLSATNVTGPYDPIPGATTPFTNPFVGPQHFFRLAP
jgi:hypothetical protein